MPKKKILLIGGRGFVGGVLASQLSEQGYRTIIPSRRRDALSPLNMLAGVQSHCANIHDPHALEILLQGVDAVVNLSGVLHGSYQQSGYNAGFAKVHVELAQKIVQAMQKTGVRRLLHVSAIGASATAPSGYLRSKAAGEKVLLDPTNNLDVTVFRPSLIVGSGDKFINPLAALMKCSPFIPLYGGNVRCQPVWVNDLAKAMMQSIDQVACYGQTYEMGGPSIYTIRELLSYVATLIGAHPCFISTPKFLATLVAPILNLLPNPPLSPDLLRSAEVESIASPQLRFPHWQPQALEAVMPNYLSAHRIKARFTQYRNRAGR